MAKKIQKLKPDTILKNYWSNNEQFADLFNAVLFDGKQMIKPDELEEMDTEESTILEHREYADSLQASRDSIKIQKKSSVYGVQLVLFGLENQEHIHYAMPMRVMGLDYAAYKKQYENNAKRYKNSDGMDDEEYLSKMKMEDKFIPVITIVVYYGEKPWDGAKTLHEMLKIPPEIAGFVNEYRMLLVEARENDLALHNINNVDLFNLLEILLDKSKPLKETKSKAIEYAKQHEVEKNVVMTVAGAANCKIDYHALDRKGEVAMYTVFEEIAKESENVGEIRGTIKAYKRMNVPDDIIIENLQDIYNLSEQEAEEYLRNI